jgi:hypothetical protein
MWTAVIFAFSFTYYQLKCWRQIQFISRCNHHTDLNFVDYWVSYSYLYEMYWVYRRYSLFLSLCCYGLSLFVQCNIQTRGIRKVVSVYFRQLMKERGRVRACDVASPTHCTVNDNLTGHLVFVLVSTEWVTMYPAIDNPATWEIRVVIRFSRSKNMSAAELQCELCAVYGQNIMSEGTARQ